MRKIAANYIFPVDRPPLKNGIITFDKNGKILELIDTQGDFKEIANLEFYNGVIVPGFVNAHCHLELSHLKNKIPQKEKLSNFVSHVVKLRDYVSEEEKIRTAQIADFQMINNGIIAVGDISNSEYSFQTKEKSKIHYHTFVEVFGLTEEVSKSAFDYAEKIYNILINKNLAASIIPHAPYSVHPILFEKIKKHLLFNKNILSIHNQESEEENLFFETQNGNLRNNFEQKYDLSYLKNHKGSSLEWIMNFLPNNQNTLLIHNTFSKEKDFEKAANFFKKDNLFPVICPKSNLFIEDKIPPINWLKNYSLCFGTDSLASNDKLSILDEMKTVRNYFPEITFEEILKWATQNGAKALNIEDKFGSLTVGKTSGINLITNFNFKEMNITNESEVKVI